jgi:hypothetical protein
MASDYQRLQNDAAEINSTGEKRTGSTGVRSGRWPVYHRLALFVGVARRLEFARTSLSDLLGPLSTLTSRLISQSTPSSWWDAPHENGRERCERQRPFVTGSRGFAAFLEVLTEKNARGCFSDSTERSSRTCDLYLSGKVYCL